MIYIRKRKTPNIIVEKATAIKKDPASGYEKLELPKDSTQLRFLFEQMPKATIRSELIKEQHGLCAYCMRRITGQQNVCPGPLLLHIFRTKRVCIFQTQHRQIRSVLELSGSGGTER